MYCFLKGRTAAMSDMQQQLEIQINDEMKGTRLDLVLSVALEDFSRSFIQKLFEKELAEAILKVRGNELLSEETLKKISDKDHVLIMLADPNISVNRFFDRPDREKQFLYQLLITEDNPQKALDNLKHELN